MLDTPEIIEVRKEQGLDIIKKHKPLGQYYYWDAAEFSYVGIYNLNGNATTRKHTYLRFCLNWLGDYSRAFLHATRLYAETEGGCFIGYEVNPENCSMKESRHFDNWPDCCYWLAQQNFAPAIACNY
jgi:hypothetical protein